MTPPITLTVPEVAQQLRISTWKAYELVRAGELPSVHIGRTIRVTQRAVDAWVAAREAESVQVQGYRS